MVSPRIRQDLTVVPHTDDDGVLYFDLRDPRTGGTLRLFDFEWWVAERFDGQRSLEELSRWAQGEFGFELNAEDLQGYVGRLWQFGLIDAAEAHAVATPHLAPAPPLPPTLAELVPEPTPAPISVALPEEAPATVALPARSSSAPADDVMGQPMIPVSVDDSDEARVPERKATLLLPTVVVPPQTDAAPPEKPDEPRVVSSISERTTVPLPMVTSPEPSPEPVARVTLPPVATAPVTPAEQERSAAGAAVEAKNEPTIEPRVESGPLPIDASGEMPSPAESAALAITTRPIAVDDDEDEGPESGAAGRWVAFFILLLALGIVAYLLFGLRRPPAAQVQVKRAQPHEITRTLGASALVKRGQPQVLRMEGGGVLASVVGDGAEVSAGMSLAVLQSHVKLQKEIGDLRERLTYYQRRRELATEKGDEAAAKEAQTKVSEKEERLRTIETAIKKAQILATRSGKVTRVLVHAGDLVSPGSEIIEIADRFLGAEVLLAASEAQGLKPGEDVQLEGTTGPVQARITALLPRTTEVLVQLELPDEVSARPGDALRLVRGRLSNVEVLPAPAVIEGDTVYVVSQGKAERRKVTIVEHRGGEVLVTGLSSGEEVVTSDPSELREGQFVQPQYSAAP